MYFCSGLDGKGSGQPPRRLPWPVLRSGLLIAAVLGVPPVRAGAQAPPARSGAETASWEILDAVTTIGLNASMLSGLGLELTGLDTSGAARSPHPLSVVASAAPSFRSEGPIALRAVVAADGFHGFEGGSLRHLGGFQLRLGTRTLDLSKLELRPGKQATALELVDASGRALLTTADAQWEFDAGRGLLRYLNADLRILPSLAHRLGDDRYVGVTVGVLDLDATLRAGPVPPPELPLVGAVPPPCGDWSGDIDVSLTGMSGVVAAGTPAVVNGRPVTVVLPSAALRNVGTANVPWYSKFTNLGNPPWNDQHPFLVWQMVRSNGGALEPIGRSDLKHAFLTINSGCDAGACTDSHILGLGCSDVYGTATNDSVDSLAWRSEVTASTGIWDHCGGIPSHFDTDGDCVEDFSGSGESSFTHGMKVAETDLQVAGASYYVEAFYIIRNDINIFNSMGYRPVAPAKPGSTWTFPNAGAYTQGPAINAWVNPTTPGPNADNRTLDTGQGRVQLAVRATQISPTRWRYAYALQNHDFDRRIKSFHVKLNGTVGVIENVAYADGDGFAANDWTPTVDTTGITWTAPASTTPPAEIDYASLVSFRFDSDQTAAPTQASLAAFEAGSPSELLLQTLAPATVPNPVADFYTLTPCRLLDTRSVPGSPIASGNVFSLDAGAASCGVPANAIAMAINVTAVGSTNGGEVAVYAADAASPIGTVSFGPGATRANNAIAMLTLDGKLKIKPSLNGGGSTHVLVDIVGYFAP
jgi:hypothetical protein